MTRKLRPPAAFATVALIGVIGAGCGSHASSDTGIASSTGVASSTGNTSTTATASKKRVADQDKSPSSTGLSRSAGSPPSPARSSPSAAGLPGSVGSPPSPARRLPTQSTHERRRHE
jgi:hypothetical protein